MMFHGLVLLAFGTFLVAAINFAQTTCFIRQRMDGSSFKKYLQNGMTRDFGVIWKVMICFRKGILLFSDFYKLGCRSLTRVKGWILKLGAVLASPIDVDVNDVIHSIIDGHRHVFSSGVYTGVHNTIAPTEYTSVEGVTLDAMPVGTYKHMFPEGYSGTASCMRLLPQVGLVAGSCSDALPYICYRKKTQELVITACGTIDTSYRLDNRTGHCYKYHAYSQPWAQAYLTCAAEGGHLAIINSAAEAQVIRDLIAGLPNEAIYGGNKGATALGFHDWTEKGVWRTIQGQTLLEAGYQDWSAGQPDNFFGSGTEGQHCGSIFRGGSRQFDDMQCSSQMPFICEKNPQSLRPVPQPCNTQYEY